MTGVQKNNKSCSKPSFRKGMVSILIPAYNEEGQIYSTLTNISNFFDNQRIDYEIIVAVDKGKDNTESLVKKFSEKNPRVKLNFSEKKQKLFSGKGSAIKRAFRQSVGNIIVFADADSSASAEQLWCLITELNACDVAAGSRALKESVIVSKQPMHRSTAGKLFSYLLKVLFLSPIKDPQCGYKAFKREVLENTLYKVKSLGGVTDLEILVRAQKAGYIIKEIPITWGHVEDDVKALSLASAIKLGIIMGTEAIKIKYRTLFNEK